MNKFQNLHFLSNTKPEPKKPTTLNIPISKGVTSSIVMICPSLSMTTSSNILTSRQTPLYSFHKPAPYLTMLEIGLDAHDPGIVFRLSLHCSHIFLLRFIDKQYFVSSLPPNAQYHLRKSPQSGSKTTLPARLQTNFWRVSGFSTTTKHPTNSPRQSPKNRPDVSGSRWSITVFVPSGGGGRGRSVFGEARIRYGLSAN